MSDVRAERRATTVARIKAAALTQIADDGAAALSMRGLARETGLSAAGLYRYYDGRDELLTDLLEDAYNDLADAVARAANGDQPAKELLVASVLAYRDWAVEHANRFLLIFGTPVPGYSAPENGRTVAANRRIGSTFFELLARAWSDGDLAQPESAQLSAAELDVAAQIRETAPDFPAELVPVALAGWGMWHGLVILEITNQLDWIYPDGRAFLRSSVQRWLAGLST